MDEPTSALSRRRNRALYKIVRDLAVKGTSIIFISHKLEEIFEICDRVTIMRDGQYIDCRDTTDIGHDELIKLIAAARSTISIRKTGLKREMSPSR